MCSGISLVVVLRIIFLDQHYMNYMFQIERTLREEIQSENKNIFMPMGYRLEMGRDRTKSEDCPEYLTVKIVKNKN